MAMRLLLVMAPLTVLAQPVYWSPRVSFPAIGRYEASAQHLALDGQGNIWSAAVAVQPDIFPAGMRPPPRHDIVLRKFDPSGTERVRVRFAGDGDDVVNSISVDAAGNVYLAGHTRSSDFPLVRAFQREHKGSGGSAFLTKVSTTGAIVFSTLLGGSRSNSAAGLAVDGEGSVYLTGSTASSDFPVSANALQKEGPAPNPFTPVPPSYAFAAKFSADGSRLIYSTYLGSLAANCSGGSSCLGVVASTAGHAIAVDGSGNAYIAGGTSSIRFPVTAGAFQTSCRCNRSAGDAFLTKLNRDGSGLVYSTYLGGSPLATANIAVGNEWAVGVAVDTAGAAVVLGVTRTQDFPVTEGALRSRNPPPRDTFEPTADAFLSFFSPDGSQLTYSTLIGGGGAESPGVLRRSVEGTYYVTGTTTSADFPATAGVLQGPGFLMEFGAAGRLLRGQRWLAGTMDGTAAVGLGGEVVAAGASSGVITRLAPVRPDSEQVLALSSAAGSTVTAQVSPGELLHLSGTNLGPSSRQEMRVAGGVAATELSGVQVRIGGRAAPLLFVEKDRIGVAVPYELAVGGTADVEVRAISGAWTTPLAVQVAEATPELFRDGSTLLAANQDGSRHSQRNPAGWGSIVALYGTGFGLPDPVPLDGSFPVAPLPTARLPVFVTVGDQPAEVLYAGPAPALIAGAWQVNVRMPSLAPSAAPYRLELSVGEHRAGVGSVYIGPSLRP